jgi:superoxide dismutase, Fe-Mn family
MPYQARSFDHLLGTPGFSDPLLKDHFTLYQGYVTNTNKLVEELTRLVNEHKAGTPAYAEIKRHLGWEFNGMRLHEIYFGNMAKNSSALDPDSDLARQMKEDFGSVDQWRQSFRAVGEMRGVGWALLCYDPDGKSLYNVWINEHDTGWLAGTVPVLLMDVWEHAFLRDYGIKRPGYIDAFLKAANWTVANQRFQRAVRELAAA